MTSKMYKVEMTCLDLATKMQDSLQAGKIARKDNPDY